MNTHPGCCGVVETQRRTCRGQPSHFMSGNGEPTSRLAGPSLDSGWSSDRSEGIKADSVPTCNMQALPLLCDPVPGLSMARSSRKRAECSKSGSRVRQIPWSQIQQLTNWRQDERHKSGRRDVVGWAIVRGSDCVSDGRACTSSLLVHTPFISLPVASHSHDIPIL